MDLGSPDMLHKGSRHTPLCRLTFELLVGEVLNLASILEMNQ